MFHGSLFRILLLLCSNPVCFALTIQAEEVVPETIVTPIGIAVAPDGRVFVQENHTHKRPKDYVGPETDRILIASGIGRQFLTDLRVSRPRFHQSSPLYRMELNL